MKHLIERMQYQYLTSNGMEFPNSLEGDLLKACYEVFMKEKTPTWGEIVLIWEKLGYDNVNISEHYMMILVK